jgi:hypothetical protein
MSYKQLCCNSSIVKKTRPSLMMNFYYFNSTSITSVGVIGATVLPTFSDDDKLMSSSNLSPDAETLQHSTVSSDASLRLISRSICSWQPRRQSCFERICYILTHMTSENYCPSSFIAFAIVAPTAKSVAYLEILKRGGHIDGHKNFTTFF